MTPHAGYQPSRSPLLAAQRRIGQWSVGRKLISRVVCHKAPYFSSIAPTFTVLEPGHVEATIRNRRRVQNHIGSVHAIAMCNLAEFVGGTAMELSLDARMRWIPVGMQVKYQSIAKTNLRAVCKLPRYDWDEPQDVVAPVVVLDEHGKEVFVADIDMRISLRKNKSA